MPEVEVIRCNGTREKATISRTQMVASCNQLLGVVAFDVVNLRDGRVMLVDDTGLVDGKPVNPEATKLYLAICKPGTRASIHGDVVIAIDEDFA